MGAAVLSGCDIPSELPIFEPRFVLPLDSTAIGPAQLLPNGVTFQGNLLALTLAPTTVARTLGQICGVPCTNATGQTVAKPAFTGSVTADLPFPDGVLEIRAFGGRVDVALTNNFNFDPLRPSASARGSIAIVVQYGSLTAVTDSVFGSTTPFAPGATISRTITIPDVRSVGSVFGPLRISATINSPAGDPIALNANESITLRVVPQAVLASAVGVAFTNRSISSPDMQIDLSDIDSTIEDHVKEGALQIVALNTFQLSGTMTITFAGANPTIAPKTFPVPTATSVRSVPLTADEVRALLGEVVTLTVSASVSTPPTGTPVSRVMGIFMSFRLDLTMTTEDTTR